MNFCKLVLFTRTAPTSFLLFPPLCFLQLQRCHARVLRRDRPVRFSGYDGARDFRPLSFDAACVYPPCGEVYPFAAVVSVGEDERGLTGGQLVAGKFRPLGGRRFGHLPTPIRSVYAFGLGASQKFSASCGESKYVAGSMGSPPVPVRLTVERSIFRYCVRLRLFSVAEGTGADGQICRLHQKAYCICLATKI
jgi:hypothetical protein